MTLSYASTHRTRANDSSAARTALEIAEMYKDQRGLLCINDHTRRITLELIVLLQRRCVPHRVHEPGCVLCVYVVWGVHPILIQQNYCISFVLNKKESSAILGIGVLFLPF